MQGRSLCGTIEVSFESWDKIERDGWQPGRGYGRRYTPSPDPYDYVDTSTGEVRLVKCDSCALHKRRCAAAKAAVNKLRDCVSRRDVDYAHIRDELKAVMEQRDHLSMVLSCMDSPIKCAYNPAATAPAQNDL